jgi:hypothetical protein
MIGSMGVGVTCLLPRSAPSGVVSCCTYQQWFAVDGGPDVDPLSSLDRGRWTDTPAYVRNTACMSRECVRALASFRVGAHDLDVATAKFQHGGAVARSERRCRLCGAGVGDELHMLAECPAYEPVRFSHAELFSGFGGWWNFPCDMSGDRLRAFMQQPAQQVGAFVRDCGRLRWNNPPDEVVFAEALSAEEAEALLGVAVEAPEVSDQYYSAMSDEYYDVYSDAYYDSGTP